MGYAVKIQLSSPFPTPLSNYLSIDENGSMPHLPALSPYLSPAPPAINGTLIVHRIDGGAFCFQWMMNLAPIYLFPHVKRTA